jgi:hypothetical protein
LDGIGIDPRYVLEYNDSVVFSDSISLDREDDMAETEEKNDGSKVFVKAVDAVEVVGFAPDDISPRGCELPLE